MRIILGSQSPRRKEILSFFDLPFEQATPPFIEEDVPFENDPAKYVLTLSKGKAESLAHKFPGAIIITADTTVYRNGKIYNKPTDKEEAFQSLSELSGHWHSVFTGVTICKDNEECQGVEETKVLFNRLTPEQIRKYQQQVHCEDKAGGYAVQHGGALIVRRIEGCFYNVMGLPINVLSELLSHFGVDLWNHLRK